MFMYGIVPMLLCFSMGSFTLRVNNNKYERKDETKEHCVNAMCVYGVRCFGEKGKMSTYASFIH